MPFDFSENFEISEIIKNQSFESLLTIPPGPSSQNILFEHFTLNSFLIHHITWKSMKLKKKQKFKIDCGVCQQINNSYNSRAFAKFLLFISVRWFMSSQIFYLVFV